MSKINELIDNLIESTGDDHDIDGIDLQDAETALRSAFEELEQQLAAEREAHRWIPVSEKLPEPGVYVLVILGGNEPALMLSLDYDKNSWRNTVGWPFALRHDCWQPLPSAQEGEK
jgi:hypothetical protein